MAARCPQCGSFNTEFRREFTGSNATIKRYNYHSKHSYFLAAGNKKINRIRDHETIGFCKNCGHTWTPQAPQRPESSGGKFLKAVGLITILGFIFLVSVALSINIENDKENALEKKVGTSVTTTANNIGPTQELSLDDLEYEIHYDDELWLTKYTGHTDKVSFPEYYNIDGNDKMYIRSFVGTFKGIPVKSVIIPPRTKRIIGGTFSDSGIEYLYIPKTVVTFDGWSELTNIKKIYYAGSKKQFKKLFAGIDPENYFNENIIVYNAKESDMP
ncbi:hypothetical protein [Butyrivibrio sp. FC2001]|uniref:hypothetical protein n=1 Tax=Butyrivibrio sp. FC2001 TaxID=1280671 RepID=UPI000405E167|nr:hypothetical protein [Butyrivibrio sp. FC2001]